MITHLAAALLAAGTPATAQRLITAGYPPRAFREGREGTAAYTVDVTADGRAENCIITQSTGSLDLDEATCADLVKRARFNPARDEHGTPVRGRFSSKMVWKLSL